MPHAAVSLDSLAGDVRRRRVDMPPFHCVSFSYFIIARHCCVRTFAGHSFRYDIYSIAHAHILKRQPQNASADCTESAAGRQVTCSPSFILYADRGMERPLIE